MTQAIENNHHLSKTFYKMVLGFETVSALFNSEKAKIQG